MDVTILQWYCHPQFSISSQTDPPNKKIKIRNKNISVYLFRLVLFMIYYIY